LVYSPVIAQVKGACAPLSVPDRFPQGSAFVLWRDPVHQVTFLTRDFGCIKMIIRWIIFLILAKSEVKNEERKAFLLL
jgi:hypothetical protein